MRQSIFVSVIVLLVCCDQRQDICGDVKVTYNDNIMNIIEESCNNGSCHVGLIEGWGVLPDFSTYKNLLPYLENNQIGSRINITNSNLRMPPVFIEERTISDSDLALLNIWLCYGYPED